MALSPLARPQTRPAFPGKPPQPLDARLQQLAEVVAMPRLPATDRIDAMRGYYLVRLTGESRSRHIVRKDRTCLEHGASCPAVAAVASYLKAGGQRAEDQPSDRLIPAACPVCGGPVKFEPRLCSPVRGAGWVCIQAAEHDAADPRKPHAIPGSAHYWAHAWESVRAYMQRGVAR